MYKVDGGNLIPAFITVDENTMQRNVTLRELWLVFPHSKVDSPGTLLPSSVAKSG